MLKRHPSRHSDTLQRMAKLICTPPHKGNDSADPSFRLVQGKHDKGTTGLRTETKITSLVGCILNLGTWNQRMNLPRFEVPQRWGKRYVSRVRSTNFHRTRRTQRNTPRLKRIALFRRESQRKPSFSTATPTARNAFGFRPDEVCLSSRLTIHVLTDDSAHEPRLDKPNKSHMTQGRDGVVPASLVFGERLTLFFERPNPALASEVRDSCGRRSWGGREAEGSRLWQKSHPSFPNCTDQLSCAHAFIPT